ncbi:MAG: HD domain-containing protein [Clostridia bacterium]|nr:HD domain-containing protein [Clostridia bacterium]
MFENVIGAELAACVEFTAEADKLKQIFRRTMLTAKNRRENDAEHSWHLALMAAVFAKFAPQADAVRAMRMVIVHDLVEIYAGDTFAYDTEGNSSKKERELAAADRIFSILPCDIGSELRGLWEEFEECKTDDAVYAASLDRFSPLLNNHLTDGVTWVEGNVTASQVYKRMEPIKRGIPPLWPAVEEIIRNGVEKGYIREDRADA